MDPLQNYQNATRATAADLTPIARTLALSKISHLSLPEVEAVANLVAQIVPAGNVPGMILSGLARLGGRRRRPEVARRDIDLLFQGVEQVLDSAVFGALFAGPAAVLWGYQNLLRLAGKDPADFFPQGTWQFYVEYALREDTARHATETRGFDARLRRHNLHLNAVDRLTAWAMAAIHCLHQYEALLQNEWRERVYTRLLCEVTHGKPEAKRCVGLYRRWEVQRPYGRGQDAAPNETYSAYRSRKFDEFLETVLADLPLDLQRAWAKHVQQAKGQDLPEYQRQMTILAFLDPGRYGEQRVPYSIDNAHLGLIVQGRYALLPVCSPGSKLPAEVGAVRTQVAHFMDVASFLPLEPLTDLARLRRAVWPKLRKRLSRELMAELDQLRFAPVLLNLGPRPRDLPLAEIRQAERGIGHHALTLFDTGESMVFDLSHIFFDGTWGSALAEILTNEALSWAVYLSQQPIEISSKPVSGQGAWLLRFGFQPGDREAIAEAAQQVGMVTPEVSAETEQVNLHAILSLRRLFKRRNDLIRLTVNDLLVLYRAIHAAIYTPDSALLSALAGLHGSPQERQAAESALASIRASQQTNPAILIPIDSSQNSPSQRLYPLNFEVPLQELGLLDLHRRCLEELAAYQAAIGPREHLYDAFDRSQRAYLATLAGFAEVLGRAKDFAAQGEDTTVGVMKLFAPLPGPVQRLLEKIPDRIEMLNDLIRGREVFSNIGAVAPGSSLVRFITAKDDNEQKTLAWGVITDATGIMRLSLRDFRPHVALLIQVGRKDLADWMVRDYLEAYARGLNAYIHDLSRITLASRETPVQEVRHG